MKALRSQVTILQRLLKESKKKVGEIFLSYGTVRNYLASAVTKLGGRNRMDAVRVATKAGWL